MRERALMRLHVATICAALMIFAVAVSARADNADSLAWESLRARATAIDSAQQALQTAEALAQAGLYTEAAEILHQYLSLQEDTTRAPLTAVPAQSRIRWRVSSGIDYYRLEDVDTSAMTPEELRDYRRLTETPLSVWLRAKLAIRPANQWIEEIAPNLYVSGHKGRIETSAMFSKLSGRFRLEPSVKTEKWFRTDASGDAPFTPANAQPSDMAGASLRIATGTASQPDRRLDWIVPLSVDWEHYRADRPGYESCVNYRFSPSLDMKLGALPISARLAAEAHFEDYYRAFSDSLDVVRLSGRAEWYMRTAKLAALASGAWMGDRYTNALSPQAIDRCEGAVRAEYKTMGFLTGCLRLRGVHEREEYGSFGNAAAYKINGSELTAEPGIEMNLGGHLKIAPQLLLERRFARRSGGRFVWEAHTAFEPQVQVGWNSSMIETSARAGFRAEDVDAKFESYTADSRSLRAGGDFSFIPWRTLSINLFADYQYRLYAPYGSRARVSENLSISGNVSVAW